MDNNTYEQEIDLKDLMFAVLRKWRAIILVAVILGILLGAYKLIGGMAEQRDPEYIKTTQEKYTKDVEEYNRLKVSYKREIENIEMNLVTKAEYLEKSILMNMSAYDKCTASADIFVKGDDISLTGDLKFIPYNDVRSIINAYVSYLNRGMDFTSLTKKLDTEEIYLKELISVSSDYDGNKFSVNVCYSDEATANEILDEILENVDDIHKNLITKLGSHELYVMNQVSGTTVDTNLAERQKQSNDEIAQLQVTLNDKEKALEKLKEPTEVSDSAFVKTGIKYGVLGGVLGAFIAIFCICVAFLMTDKVTSAKELKKRYGIKVLAVFPEEQKKRAFAGIDGWLNKLEGKIDNLSEEARYDLMAANLKNYVGDAKNIMVIGTVNTDILNDVKDHLGKLCPDMTLTVGVDLNKNAETVSKLPEYDAVVLVEKSKVSRYGEIEKEIEAVLNVKKNIIGAVIF